MGVLLRGFCSCSISALELVPSHCTSPTQIDFCSFISIFWCVVPYWNAKGIPTESIDVQWRERMMATLDHGYRSKKQGPCLAGRERMLKWRPGTYFEDRGPGLQVLIQDSLLDHLGSEGSGAGTCLNHYSCYYRGHSPGKGKHSFLRDSLFYDWKWKWHYPTVCLALATGPVKIFLMWNYHSVQLDVP